MNSSSFIWYFYRVHNVGIKGTSFQNHGTLEIRGVSRKLELTHKSVFFLLSCEKILMVSKLLVEYISKSKHGKWCFSICDYVILLFKPLTYSEIKLNNDFSKEYNF